MVLLPGPVIQAKQPKPRCSLKKWRSLRWPLLGEPWSRLLGPHGFQWNSSLCFYSRDLSLLGTQTCFHEPRLVTELSNSYFKLYLLLPIQWLSLSSEASLSNSLPWTWVLFEEAVSAPRSAGFFLPYLTSSQTCPDRLAPQQHTQLRVRLRLLLYHT